MPVLGNFRRVFSSGPTDCPWVSEDVFEIEATFRCFNMTDLSHLHLRQNPAEYCDELYGLFDVLREKWYLLSLPADVLWGLSISNLKWSSQLRAETQ